MSFHFGSEQFEKVLILGNVMRDATRNYNVAFENALDDTEDFITEGQSEPVDEKFFEMLKNYQRVMFTGYHRRKSKNAIQEFVRKATCDGDFFNVMRFAKTYSRLVNLISVNLWDVIEGYGEDGFGDLCDSLPLAGKKVIYTILAGEVRNNGDLKTLLESVVVGNESEDNRRFILQGENYNRMYLREQLARFFVIAANDWKKAEEEEDDALDEETDWFDD